MLEGLRAFFRRTDKVPSNRRFDAAGGGVRSSVRFGHPSGTLRVGAEAAQLNGQWKVTKALMSRSARILMEGWVRVPADNFKAKMA